MIITVNDRALHVSTLGLNSIVFKHGIIQKRHIEIQAGLIWVISRKGKATIHAYLIDDYHC